jgi:membrane fusion protein (multidrug efflux system)
VDRQTRNVQIRALFENPDRLLRPGMFAKVETLLPQKDKVLTLPRQAVTFNTYGDSVFVIEEQAPAEDAGDQAEIQRGAEAGGPAPPDRHRRRARRSGGGARRAQRGRARGLRRPGEAAQRRRGGHRRRPAERPEDAPASNLDANSDSGL